MTRGELIAAVPVHYHDDFPYFVALEEIPEPWRGQFWSALYGCACPVFDGFERCAFFWDWEVWARGKWLGVHRGPTGLEGDQTTTDDIESKP